MGVLPRGKARKCGFITARSAEAQSGWGPPGGGAARFTCGGAAPPPPQHNGPGGPCAPGGRVAEGLGSAMYILKG